MNTSRNVRHRMMGAAILALLSFVVAVPAAFASPAASVRASLSTLARDAAVAAPHAGTLASTGVSLTQGSPDDCKNVTVSRTDLIADFCSPSFVSEPDPTVEAEGPDGSAVEFIIGNVPGVVLSIFLFDKNSDPQSCADQAQSPASAKCLPFSGPIPGTAPAGITGTGPGHSAVYKFTWTFPTDGMQTPAYFQLGIAYKSLLPGSAKTKPITSKKTFELLSATPPCVAVSLPTNPVNCATSTQSHDLTVLQGDRIEVTGSGWHPYDVAQQIIVTAICATQSKCSNQSFDLGTYTSSVADQSDNAGAFSQDHLLPGDATGDYVITASTANGAITSSAPGLSNSLGVTLHILPYPCLVVNNAQGGCVWNEGKQSQLQSVIYAKSTTILGLHWKSGSQVVALVAQGKLTQSDCSSRATTAGHQSQRPPNAGSDGSIQLTLTMPAKVQYTSVYTICAIGPSPVGTGQVVAVAYVHITKPVTHPLFSLLSLLGLLFGLISIAAYVLSARQRAPVPQPVARR